MNKKTKLTAIMTLAFLLLLTTQTFAQAVETVEILTEINKALKSGGIVAEVSSATGQNLKIFTSSAGKEVISSAAQRGIVFDKVTKVFVEGTNVASDLKLNPNNVHDAGSFLKTLAKNTEQLDKMFETGNKLKATTTTSSQAVAKLVKTKKALADSMRKLVAQRTEIQRLIQTGKVSKASRYVNALKNAAKTGTRWGSRLGTAANSTKKAAVTAGKFISNKLFKKGATTGSKSLVRKIGGVIFKAGKVAALPTLGFTLGYWGAEKYYMRGFNIEPPNASVFAGGPAMFVTDDDKTHIFFTTTIDPNSALSIQFDTTFKQTVEENEDIYQKSVQFVGENVIQLVPDIMDVIKYKDDAAYLEGCFLEIYSLDENNKRETLVDAMDYTGYCRTGHTIGNEWIIDDPLPPGNYQLVLYARLAPELIGFTQKEILRSSGLYRGILENYELPANNGLPDEFTQADPLIQKIVWKGLPAATGIITLEEEARKGSNLSNDYKLKFFNVSYFETGEPEDFFRLNEKENIQVNFDFAHPVTGFFVSIHEKSNPEKYGEILFGPTGSFPDGNPFFVDPGFAYYIINTEGDLQEDKPIVGSFSDLISPITEEGVYVVSFFILGSTKKPLEDQLPAATTEIFVGIETGGRVEFEISNLTAVNARGFSLGDYAKRLKVKNEKGEVVASFFNEGGGKVAVAGDLLIITNISKSYSKSLNYILEWTSPEGKIKTGSFTVGPEQPDEE